MTDVIKKAISQGNLLKIDYSAGKQSLHHQVIRPLSINQGVLVCSVLETRLPRKLKIKQLTVHDFFPQFVDGPVQDDVDHLRWYIGSHVPDLFYLGWLIHSDEDYIGIYPRQPDDTVATDRLFAEHACHLLYIKSAEFAFHVWDESGKYHRLNNFDQAMALVMRFADCNRRRL